MNPKASFIISTADRLSSLTRESLDLLYQPILRSPAYSLINLLWRLNEGKPNASVQQPIANLLSFLSISERVFNEARIRLEGAGLIRTFSLSNHQDSLYVYRLVRPLTPREFYNDDLLSIYLLETVGPVQYRKLNRDLIPHPQHFKSQFRNITHNFLQVFTINQKDLTQPPKIIQELNTSSSQQPDQSRAVSHGDFDFALLLNSLKNSFVNLNDVRRFKRLILSEHALYGIDEVAMAHFLQRATSVTNNHVNFRQFKLVISAAFQKDQGQKSRHQPVQSKKGSSSLTAQEQRLVSLVDDYSPANFLEQLKAQVYHTEVVTHKELNAIRKTMEYGAFDDNRGVVNIMIYYMIVDCHTTSLSQRFMDQMVNSWTAAQVNTAEDALNEIKKFKHSKQKKWRQYTQNKYHRYRGRQRRPIKEPLPKWAKKGYHPKLHPTSPALQREIRERLKRLGEIQPKSKGGIDHEKR